MIDDEEEAKMLRLFRAEKWTIGTIAKQMGRHYSTVKLALKRAGEDTSESTRVRMVDPYVPFLEQTLAKYPDLYASRLYQMVKERGYPGELDHFRGIVALYRPRPAAEAFLRLRTLPGEQAQVDWGHFGQVKIGQALERERPRLLELPAVPYPVQERLEVSVGKTPYARFDKNDYSVPHDRVQRTLVVQATPQQVRILDGTLVVATHARTYDQSQTVEDPAHIEALVQRKQEARAHRGLNHLSLAVPQTQDLLVRLAQRGGNLGSATAALMRLLAHHGPTEMQAAVAEALEHNAPHPNAVRLILDRRLQQRKQPPPLAVALPKDPRIQNLSVVPHSLATYDALAQEEDDVDLSKLF
jgi:hypothetical protein